MVVSSVDKIATGIIIMSTWHTYNTHRMLALGRCLKRLHTKDMVRNNFSPIALEQNVLADHTQDVPLACNIYIYHAQGLKITFEPT